jgi:hypothetical protein
MDEKKSTELVLVNEARPELPPILAVSRLDLLPERAFAYYPRHESRTRVFHGSPRHTNDA